MNLDITFCEGIDCPIKNSCKRYKPDKRGCYSQFIDMPCEWYNDWFYCEEFWDNKPIPLSDEDWEFSLMLDMLI